MIKVKYTGLTMMQAHEAGNSTLNRSRTKSRKSVVAKAISGNKWIAEVYYSSEYDATMAMLTYPNGTIVERSE